MNKKSIYILLSILIVCCGIFILFKKSNKTIEDAMYASNVPFDEIIHETEHKGFIIIFYTFENNLSAGLLEKKWLGYKWGFGGGSNHFSEPPLGATWSISNLTPQGPYDEDDIVSIAKGVVYDNEIKEIIIHFRDSDNKAIMIDTSVGRIWYSFSKSPINYTPDVTFLFEDGTSKQGWY